jgi:two-component system, NarL family, sensor kinase
VWILPAGAVAATGTGVALLVAASGPSAVVGWALLQNVVVALVPTLLSLPLLRRPSGRRIGLLLALGGTATALGLLAEGYATAGGPAAGAAAWLGRWLWALTVVPMTTVLLALFPDGRAPTPRWRPVVWLGWAVTATVAVENAWGLTALTPLTSAMWVAAGVGGLAALGARWRAARGVARQQVKYLVLAGLLVLVLYAVADLLPYHLRQAAFLAVPLLLLGGVALAVLRYRLYDVDLVIRRTAVFVGVTGLVFLAYLAVAAAFGTDPSQRAALVAAVVVAVVAEPARRRLQRATTRLLFGRRDEPLAALALLRDRLRDATDDAELAAAVTEVVPPLLRTRAVALHLFRDGELQEVARTGAPGDNAEEFPLVHQSELLGTLTVGLREPGVAFGRADRILLAELSHPVAAAAHAVRLQAELRAAADRVLRAAAAERERLRRELHDRLGPLLVGTGLAVDALRRGVAADTPTGSRLAEVADQLRSASGEVRRIVDQLQPATLLELGLAAAVREHLDRLTALPGVPAFDLLDGGAGPLPPTVQEAAYFLLLEAVTNVLRHARATQVVVRIERRPGVLEVEVRDDGAGMTEPYVAGVGIGSMRRRALELGGSCTVGPAPTRGTRVCATFPLEEPPLEENPWATPPAPSVPSPSGSSSPTTTPSSGSACAASSTPSPASRSSVRPPTASGPLPR